MNQRSDRSLRYPYLIHILTHRPMTSKELQNEFTATSNLQKFWERQREAMEFFLEVTDEKHKEARSKAQDGLNRAIINIGKCDRKLARLVGEYKKLVS